METLQAFGAVAFVLSLLLAVLFILRKRGIASFAAPFSIPGLSIQGFARQASGKEMEVLERVPLGPQHFLHLVRVGETKCLVTTSPGACQVHTFPIRTNS